MMSNMGAVRRQIQSVYDLISTSHHEAGHVIFALLHFVKVSYVYVTQNKNKKIEGSTHYEILELSSITDLDFCKNIAKLEICINYAGLLAEKYHFKTISGSDKFPLCLKNGSSEDTLSAAAILKKYNLAPPGTKRYLFKQKLIKNTSQKLQLYWDDVILIAHELFLKSRLNYLDLKSLLLKKSINSKFWKQTFDIIDEIYDINFNEQRFRYYLNF